MKQNVNIKKNMKYILATFCCLFVLLGSYLLYNTVTKGDQWFTTPYNPRIAAAKNIENAGAIYDRNGVPLAYTQDGERKYAADGDMRRAVSHVVGDSYGKSLGAETYLAKYLYGYDQGVLDKVASAASGSKGGDVYLTIDADLSQYIYNNMEFDGSVVVMDYKTGEILASVSVPTFDPYKIKDDEDETGSKYLDRATQGRYPPGSTMKIVTTAAALENGKTDLVIECDAEEVIDGQRITCPSERGHGTVDFTKAFEKSCNIYYAKLAVELGKSRMLQAAEGFMFNRPFNLPDFTLYRSSFEVSDSDGDLAWAGIGQYKDLVTPMHDMLFSASVANGGTMMQPKMLLDVTYGNKSGYRYATDTITRAMDSATAEKIKELMKGTVQQGTATSAQLGSVTVAGKTGTAEYYEDGGIKNHSWFTGFIEDEQHPLAIAVILEGAGFGSRYATPLAAKVLQKALDIGY